MVASSAWGMGIDNPGLEHVARWGVKRLENLDTVIPRFGRAGRSLEVQGACFPFAEAKYRGARVQRRRRTIG